jgi:NSS family neurotransmitter:Na+ symporter
MEKKVDTQERGHFSGKIGFVLAAAGSAVGLGNIWRFPYLAAKYGGGMFLLVYILLVLTFGYVMIMSETTLGRMTRKSPVGAFAHFGKGLRYRFGGWINAIIPVLIVPYYSVIGGWVLKYLVEYLRGNVQPLASSHYFEGFLANGIQVEGFFIIFSLMTIFIVLAGVKNGIEKVSTIMMPILVALAVIVAIYSITRPGAMEGVKYLLVPNFKHFSIMTVVAAMGQMFYSLSVAMGILYTFGSYAKKNMDLETSTTQLEIFDTAIAILAGLMIIPAVFAFSGGSAADLGKGPSLMFITIPKVFASMDFGLFGGIMFFALVLLAALTSSISLLESAVSTFEDEFHWNRKIATIFTSILMLLLGTLSSLGFNYLSFVSILGMGILDFFDFITNSVMMPIAAITTVLLILFKVKPETIVKEVESSGQFKRKKIYLFFIKYVAILFLLIILVSSLLDIMGIIKL